MGSYSPYAMSGFYQGWDNGTRLMNNMFSLQDRRDNEPNAELQRQMLADELQTAQLAQAEANQTLRDIINNREAFNTREGVLNFYNQNLLNTPEVGPSQFQWNYDPANPRAMNLINNQGQVIAQQPAYTGQAAINDVLRNYGTSLFDLRNRLNSDDRFAAGLAAQQATNQERMQQMLLRQQLQALYKGYGKGGYGTASGAGGGVGSLPKQGDPNDFFGKYDEAAIMNLSSQMARERMGIISDPVTGSMVNMFTGEPITQEEYATYLKNVDELRAAAINGLRNNQPILPYISMQQQSSITPVPSTNQQGAQAQLQFTPLEPSSQQASGQGQITWDYADKNKDKIRIIEDGKARIITKSDPMFQAYANAIEEGNNTTDPGMFQRFRNWAGGIGQMNEPWTPSGGPRGTRNTR